MPTLMLCCRSRQAFLTSCLQRGADVRARAISGGAFEETSDASSCALSFLGLFEDRPDFVRQWRALRKTVLPALPNFPRCYLAPLEDERRLLRLLAALGLDGGWAVSAGEAQGPQLEAHVAAARASKVQSLQRALSLFPVYVQSQAAVAFEASTPSAPTLRSLAARGGGTKTQREPALQQCSVYHPSFLSTRDTLTALESIYTAAASRLAGADARSVTSLALEKAELHLALVRV